MTIRPQDERICVGDKIVNVYNDVYGPVPAGNQWEGKLVSELPIGYTCFKPITSTGNRRLAREIGLSTKSLNIQ